MRRLEAGPSGRRGADNCATPRGFLPCRKAEKEVSAVAVSRAQHARPTARRPKPRNARAPGRWPLGWTEGEPGFALPFAVAPGSSAVSRASPQRWITMSVHRGFRGASLKHRVRNAGVPAESRFTTTCRGIARCHGARVRFRFGGTAGPGVPRAPQGGGRRRRRGRIPRRHKNRERGAMLRRLFDNRDAHNSFPSW
jgi:hypothetical protein